MKKLLTLFAAIAMLFVASCGGDEYDDTALRNELTDLANRVAKLEQLCQQMNTNISSLQTIVNALQQNDFITAVVPVTQGGKVIGYTITFSRSGAITIYHGNAGADGKDGSTPQISVKQDSDGIYYWTLNGEWLLDADGNKIQAEGKDGADGSNGTNGKDGVTPQLKIEEGYWYISYDNGSSWTQLGKAVSDENADDSEDQNGDNIFSDITQDDEFVYFYLSDGTMITLPKHDKENIQFEDLNVKAICCRNWDTNNDGELSYAEAAAVTDIDTTFKGNTNIIAFNELKYFTGLTAIADSAFSGCENLWKVQLPNSVETIGKSAFSSCSKLANISIPERVTIIESSTFYSCKGLKDLGLPNSITSIGSYAFGECSKLTNLVIPEGVTSIAANAFSGCTSLQRTIIPSSVTAYGNQVFEDCTGIVYVKGNLPDATDESGKPFRLSKFTQIIFEDSVTSIGESSGESIFLPSDADPIVDIGKNVKTIGDYAFCTWNSTYGISGGAVYVRATTPPEIGVHVFKKKSEDFFGHISYSIYGSPFTIYVPSQSLSLYKIRWSEYSSRMEGYDFEADPHGINK